MPSFYVHIRAAVDTMVRLKEGVPAGSPLTQAQAHKLYEAAERYPNYFAAGAYGPDLFFLLPDFKGDQGKVMLNAVNFVLDTWKKADDAFLKSWNKWMTPVLDEGTNLANSVTGGMLGEVSEALQNVSSGLQEFLVGMLAQIEDAYSLLSSAPQVGYDDSGFFWSDAFHYRKTYAFARALYKNAQHAADPILAQKQTAFALGWMSHCAMDVAAHPFTNAKCGGPFRTHAQRHHLIENHMDAYVYKQKHEGPLYESLVNSALHRTLAFCKNAKDPTGPADAWLGTYFPTAKKEDSGFPDYPEGESLHERQDRAAVFEVDSEKLPDHLCDLLQRCMKEVYGGKDDQEGPQVLHWDPGKFEGKGGRPTKAVLKDMYDVAFRYVKFVASAGNSPRAPTPPLVINDHSLPRPPGIGDDSAGADPLDGRELTVIDILLAIVAFAIWLAEVSAWIVTLPVAVGSDIATWPLRELLYQVLVLPAWELYLRCRSLLVLQGYITPRPEEISLGLVVLGVDEKGPLVQLRADLEDDSGFAVAQPLPEPSGLDATRGASCGGFGLDRAYPRAMVTDPYPPWTNAPIDSQLVGSEFVAPWRYPHHTMGGMRVGWEAPRTHVGPFLHGSDATVLMGGMPGSDDARRKYEEAKTPEDTERVAASLMSHDGAHLGDGVDYGMYVIARLVTDDDDHALPDFNLDGDRGYASKCWDYLRHEPSMPPGPPQNRWSQVPWPKRDIDFRDQWQCVPGLGDWDKFGDDQKKEILDRYGYQEPLTVPQRYSPADNPHHASAYDPLKRLATEYLPVPENRPPRGDLDLDVSEQEMKEAGMSPTGRLVP